MQSSSLLELRRSAWQFCSTSRCSPSHSHRCQPAAYKSRQTGTSDLQAKRLVTNIRRAPRLRGILPCNAQLPETKQRKAEQSGSSNGSSGKNGSSNGSSGNGSGTGMFSNGSSANGSLNGAATTRVGNGKLRGSENKDQGNLGSYDKNEDIEKPVPKGTLDQLLESSRQVPLILSSSEPA